MSNCQLHQPTMSMLELEAWQGVPLQQKGNNTCIHGMLTEGILHQTTTGQ